jgi:hypothetical protein
VTRVTATSDAVGIIGNGNGDTKNSSCGTITFGTKQMYDGSEWTTIPDSGQTYGGLKFIISTDPNISYINTWELTPASTPAPSCRRITLDTVQHHFVAQDCDTLTGTLGANVKISIAEGATVTLDNVTIKGTGSSSYKWAGITCLGDATIILKDGTTDTVKGFYEDYPGIQAAHNTGSGDEYTLTIQGTGSLTASSNGWGAGIGGGWEIDCGNIEIQGGTITATGGTGCAGIGAGNGGYNDVASCGTITISGGTITATGGEAAAGIGSGTKSSCGNITITSDVTHVTATKGEGANSIGAGVNGTCGTVTIEDESKVTKN